MRKFFHWFFAWFVKITAIVPYLLCFRPKTYYEDKKKQGKKIKGKAIVISNHRSVWDVAVMLFLFWRRMPRCLIAELMFEKNALFTFFLKALGGIKVDRNAHDFSFVKKSCDVLEKNGLVEIYPESRLPKEGEARPLPFKPSAAYIALLSGAPIVPVYTNGSYFRKERTRVLVGTPIDVRAMYDENLSESENLEKISEELRNKIIRLGHELDKQTNEKKKKTEN